MRKYVNPDSGSMVYFNKGNKNLMDELWYRLMSSYEESEKFTPAMMKQIKQNFYGLEKQSFKHLIKSQSLKGYGTKEAIAKFK
jgi:hypothetical protein